jgi:hypothetical protein
LANFKKLNGTLGKNRQRATLQAPQGLDAKHSDELFLVQRQYTGVNSGARRAPLRWSKNFGLARQNRAPFLNLEFATFAFGGGCSGWLPMTRSIVAAISLSPTRDGERSHYRPEFEPPWWTASCIRRDFAGTMPSTTTCRDDNDDQRDYYCYLPPSPSLKRQQQTAIRATLSPACARQARRRTNRRRSS